MHEPKVTDLDYIQDGHHSSATRQFLSDPSAVLRGFPQAGMAHKRATA